MSKPHRDLRPIAVLIRRRGPPLPAVTRAELDERLTRVVEHAQAQYLARRLGAHLQARGEA